MLANVLFRESFLILKVFVRELFAPKAFLKFHLNATGVFRTSKSFLFASTNHGSSSPGYLLWCQKETDLKTNVFDYLERRPIHGHTILTLLWVYYFVSTLLRSPWHLMRIQTVQQHGHCTDSSYQRISAKNSAYDNMYLSCARVNFLR